ncbi:hypothetical protein LXL04_011992 [Taraxacum kok-saghyz]
MGSKTQRPFHTTNLIVFSSRNNHDKYESGHSVAQGDTMIVDPGCRSKELIVFVTHHHRDHVDGLSTVQKTNPDACLLAHENTINRIRKDDWSLGCTRVSGTEEICIGGERFKIISAPGHTDGHLALLHVSTNSLIVGDHCVGQGSVILDINSGGNMSAYFQTTYKFMDMSPNALISLRGRVNLWPKHMLCGYLKNRSSRESTILKAIEEGSRTLYDIVAYTYADVDRSLWVPAAWNVRLHVEHLSQQNKLPKVNVYVSPKIILVATNLINDDSAFCPKLKICWNRVRKPWVNRFEIVQDFDLENFSRSISQFTVHIGKL